MRNEVLCFKVSSDNLDMYLLVDIIFYVAHLNYYTLENETFKTSQSVK